jgi:hypothetical protein
MARVGRKWWEVAWLLRFCRNGPHDQAERLKDVWATFGPRRRPLDREAGTRLITVGRDPSHRAPAGSGYAGEGGLPRWPTSSSSGPGATVASPARFSEACRPTSSAGRRGRWSSSTNRASDRQAAGGRPSPTPPRGAAAIPSSESPDVRRRSAWLACAASSADSTSRFSALRLFRG